MIKVCAFEIGDPENVLIIGPVGPVVVPMWVLRCGRYPADNDCWNLAGVRYAVEVMGK